MTDEQLDKLFDALLDANCLCEMSDLLSPLSDDDIHAVHEEFLFQYGQELASGALERSEWTGGNILISANQPPICFLRTALDAVRKLMDGRKGDGGDWHVPGTLN